ncbi:dihydrofolate reductase family protein [Micromonospora sp. ATA32]|nr:dihydrofolate reductase family protein [Micromonospora sp. ATA32]
MLKGDVADAAADLKRQPGPYMAVLVSGELARSLSRQSLVDEYVLLIHPLLLGAGRRLFPDATVPTDLRLVDSVTTTTGVVIATYRPR